MPNRSNATRHQVFLRSVSVQSVPFGSDVVSVPAGAVGTIKDFTLKSHPIANNLGSDVGGEGDTSIAITAGDVFVTEVGFKEDADLAAGEFYVDHLTGKGRGKKATTNTTMTFTYNVFALQTAASLPSLGWSVDKSAALEASTISKASAGFLRSISGRIDSTAPSATYYVQLLNSATLSADGAVTLLVAPMKIVHSTGTDSNFTMDFTDDCIAASAGIVLCLSTSEFTKTISGAYFSGTVLYR